MKVKGILSMITALVITLSIAGCNNTVTEDGKVVDVPIEKIEWSVDQGIVDGERQVMLSYTNSSAYTITSFDISFKEKDGLEKSAIDTFYSDIQKSLELDDGDMSQLKDKAISMHTESNHVVTPGSSTSKSYCY